MAQILVVEDEAAVAAEIIAALRAEGHEPTHIADGAAGLARALADAFDAITLDRMLPGLDGMGFVQRLRAEGRHTPVLMISAMGEIDDRVAGLRAGGDDYLVKPFAPAELAARMEALLRRGRPTEAEPASLRAGAIEIDLIRRTVTVAGTPVKLLHMEFRLLEYLMRNQGAIVTRGMIFEQVWGYRFDPGANLINVHIARLRKKLDRPDAESAIATIKGEGYRFDAG